MPEIKYCPQCREKLVLKMIDAKKRMVCPSEACGYVFWDSPITVAAALVEYEGKIVLARNKDWPEKWFGLITGFLEKGETIEDGTLREVKEELGLDGEVARFIGIYPFFERNQLIIAYHVKAEGKVVLGEELVEVKHVVPEKLKPWPMGTGHAVRDWLQPRGISA